MERIRCCGIWGKKKTLFNQELEDGNQRKIRAEKERVAERESLGREN